MVRVVQRHARVLISRSDIVCSDTPAHLSVVTARDRVLVECKRDVQTSLQAAADACAAVTATETAWHTQWVATVAAMHSE